MAGQKVSLIQRFHVLENNFLYEQYVPPLAVRKVRGGALLLPALLIAVMTILMSLKSSRSTVLKVVWLPGIELTTGSTVASHPTGEVATLME